ncbi:ABC transporter ATP-binding protein [Micromonospora sp. DT201]|uniref:ABC transporter ATP-binding protein n=1 Tax=Micromonospora sp. DT201 TaxID=3393442 RepID=UPI003CF71F60
MSNFSLDLPAGQAVALRGRNGAGKSTLLRTVAGLLTPRFGTILVDGEPADETRIGFRRTVSALLDDAVWYPSLTVREHLELVRLVAGPPVPGWWTPSELADRLGVSPVADDSPVRLSSGQRQRLALAMTFARGSRLLLLDEPERHLDTAGRAVVADLVGGYLEFGGVVLSATHEPAIAAVCRTVDMDAADTDAVDTDPADTDAADRSPTASGPVAGRSGNPAPARTRRKSRR